MAIETIPDFQPLSHFSFLQFYTSEGIESELGAERLYNAWLSEYLRKAYVFYQAYAAWESKKIEREFKQHYGLEEQSIVEDFWDEWLYWRNSSGANSTLEEIDKITEQMGYQRNEIYALDHEGYLGRPPGLGDYFEAYPKLSFIDELWFNETIDTEPAEQSKLRALPYPRYLKSAHWKKVRLSMLLIHRAVCQAEPCRSIGESWYFGDWESEIHVHHLSYSNLGRERYRDLALLCSKHHELLHAAQNQGQPPHFEIIY